MIKESNDPRPPQWAVRLIELYCKPELAEDLLGDLNEYFDKNVKTKGTAMARLIYVIDALKFFRIYTVKKLNFLNLIINWIMLGSYIKTSGRNILRNKLFSAINIIGLAISMSVGLLLLSFLNDLQSYDQFHKYKDRIFRVNSTNQYLNEDPYPYASTSVLTGKLIKENMTGVEKVTTLNVNFGGDAQFGDKIIPLEGMWADESFLQVFSFPWLEGDPKTALAEPYSLVITERAAQKLFGDENPLGKFVALDTLNYFVTGVMKDVPDFSQMKFEMLGSFSTLEILRKDDPNFLKWDNMWMNYVYVLLPEGGNPSYVQSNLTKMAEEQNALVENWKIQLYLQPLKDVVLGEDISNPIGANVDPNILWVVGILAFVVILSACFNYTNLSIARALRRSREVGVRKVIGAHRIHVFWQFLSESILVSLVALILSLLLFLLMRPQLLGLDPMLTEMIHLNLGPKLILQFIILAGVVGFLSGVLPAIFFSRINPVTVLKNVSTIKVFRHLNFRKALIVVQYTISLMFITATIIGYYQYKGFLSFDLGFQTENILNVKIQGNKTDLLKKEFSEIPEVTQISSTSMITSVGSYWGTTLKYKNPNDSISVYYNNIDENYLPLHGHKLLAGRNYEAKFDKTKESEIIVNEAVLRRFNIGDGDPQKALGEYLDLDGNQVVIIGILKDFHYGKVTSDIIPVAFRYANKSTLRYLNLKISSNNLPATMEKIEKAWKKIDNVHPIEAKFYDDQIERAYSEYSAMVKTIGFLSFLAISIASLGLFGMVVFTTETRQKEIGIRKALGANIGGIIYLLSKSFLLLLTIASLIALPVTYFFFEKFILADFAFHAPIHMFEIFLGFGIVATIALVMIGSQTYKVAHINPSSVLQNE